MAKPRGCVGTPKGKDAGRGIIGSLLQKSNLQTTFPSSAIKTSSLYATSVDFMAPSPASLSCSGPQHTPHSLRTYASGSPSTPLLPPSLGSCFLPTHSLSVLHLSPPRLTSLTTTHTVADLDLARTTPAAPP